MVTKVKKVTKKEPTAGEALAQLKKDMKNQKEINADLYNLILQAADDNTLRTKINKAHDRITDVEESINVDRVSANWDASLVSILNNRVTNLETRIDDDNGFVGFFIAGILFATIIVGMLGMLTGVI